MSGPTFPPAYMSWADAAQTLRKEPVCVFFGWAEKTKPNPPFLGGPRKQGPTLFLFTKTRLRSSLVGQKIARPNPLFLGGPKKTRHNPSAFSLGGPKTARPNFLGW